MVHSTQPQVIHKSVIQTHMQSPKLLIKSKNQKPKTPKNLGFWQKPTTHGQNIKNPGFFTTLHLSQNVFGAQIITDGM